MTLTDIARRLRANSTDAERKLWGLLRARRFEAVKFRRQQPIGNYVVDFVCFERKLVVEVDGGQHADRVAEDEMRTAWLEEQGFRVLRFWNNDVLANPEGVCQRIADALNDGPGPR